VRTAVSVLPLADVVTILRLGGTTPIRGIPQGPGTPTSAFDLSKCTVRCVPTTTHTDTGPLSTEAETKTEPVSHLFGGGFDGSLALEPVTREGRGGLLGDELLQAASLTPTARSVTTARRRTGKLPTHDFDTKGPRLVRSGGSWCDLHGRSTESGLRDMGPQSGLAVDVLDEALEKLSYGVFSRRFRRYIFSGWMFDPTFGSKQVARCHRKSLKRRAAGARFCRPRSQSGWLRTRPSVLHVRCTTANSAGRR
jgi:hypothetical protein